MEYYFSKKMITLCLLGCLISCKPTDNNHIGYDEKSITISKTEPQDSLITFLIFGELGPVGYLDRDSSITHSYGFKLKRIADCEVDNIAVEGSKQHNREAIQQMNNKFGADWMKNFEKKTKLKLAIPLN